MLKEHFKKRWGHVEQFSRFCLRQQLSVFKEFCIEKKLSNIFKTTNVTKLTKAILKSSYRVQQKSPCFISCMIFEEKYFSGYILLTDQISLSGCLYFVRYWAILCIVIQYLLQYMCIVSVCWPGCDIIDFEIRLLFIIKPFFLHDQNVKTKI